MRSYTYEQDNLQGLFARIVEQLGADIDSNALIHGLLEEVCEYFRFGRGFIYEYDHTYTLHIHEQYASYISEPAPPTIKLEDCLTPEAFQRLAQGPLFVSTAAKNLHQDSEWAGLARLFGAGTLLLVPVANPSGRLMGLVGLTDRRGAILLEERAVRAAQTILALLANYVKLRVYQRGLEYAQTSLVNILDHMGVDIYVNDFYTYEILYVNKSMASLYGGRENLLGRKCWQALYDGLTGPCEHCPKVMILDDEGNPGKMYSRDCQQRPADGSWFRVLSAAFRWFDGRLAHVVSLVDITENKRNEAIITQMANYDALTNLPNRRKLIRDCDEMIRRLTPSGGGAYLLFLDLDNFKAINDTLGHCAGDELLKQIGRALQTEPLTKNHAYRHSGDEFVLLLENASETSIYKVLSFLLKRFNRPWELASVKAVCRASIGVARFPEDGQNTGKLLHKADMMMYEAKKAGKGRAFFSDGRSFKPEPASRPVEEKTPARRSQSNISE